MSAPNGESVALEVALDEVLARYGVPLFLGGDADRGDLASDLATAARRIYDQDRDP